MLRPALVQSEPASTEEFLRQPLVWNPLVRTSRGHMVGSRPHVSWGAMAAGPARSLGDWIQFCQLPEDGQQARLVGLRGSAAMIEDITEAIPERWTRQTLSHAPAWMGAFTRTEVLIAVRGCSQETTLYFEVGPGGQLQRVESEAGLISYCVFQRVRVLGAHGRVWHVDPSPDVVASPGWRLWAWESRSMVRLQWDPGEWQ